jgi:hypothetical protein
MHAVFQCPSIAIGATTGALVSGRKVVKFGEVQFRNRFGGVNGHSNRFTIDENGFVVRLWFDTCFNHGSEVE